MRLFKTILSIVLVLVMVCSSFVFGTVSAVSSTSATNYNLQDNIQDGVILHAFCWGYTEIKENLADIAAAGYTAIQTSPVQQPKDISASTDISGQWWKLYQPVSLSIADNTWLGTKAELTDLCTEAEKYGIKIVCDIVSNHLGASEESGVYQLDDEVATYEPTIWNTNGATKNNPYIHQTFTSANDSDATSLTQGVSSACPDLNTGNDYVQQSVVDLLKECIDCGVDGFRFDAAKHIETPSDTTSSDYWPTVINTATAYAKSTKNIDLWCYGEILNTAGTNRSYSFYTPYMSVTSNTMGNQIRENIVKGNASNVVSQTYASGVTADKALIWAESHDTYYNSSDSADVSNEDIIKTWAMVASRKDATSLYFARPGSMSMGTASSDTTYKSLAVTEINNFHNDFVGQSETVGSSGNYAYVVRGTSGMVIVNTNGTDATVAISGTGLNDGTYTDMISGNTFTVSGGAISGKIGGTGVAVITKGSTTPYVSADKESQTFEGESINVKLSIANATSGTFQLENYNPIKFTGTPTINIGSDYDYGDTITLTLTATDGTNITTKTYKYTKTQAASSGVYVILPASTIKSSNWTVPVYCYIYDEKTTSGIEYKNNAWPGEKMIYDEALDAYYVQVKSNSCYQQTVGTETVTASNFDLVSSSNACVIVSDSAASNGSQSQGKQYPLSSSYTTLKLDGTSHIFSSLSTSGWKTTTEVPGQSSNVKATEVTQGNDIITPVGDGIIGDVNKDNSIDITDVTTIQKHLALINTITDATSLKLADTNKDGYISIKDATYIQKYIVGIDSHGYVGDALESDSETTTPTAPTEPEVPTYTIYFKTTLSWMNAMGCNVYAYDCNSGESYIMLQDENAYPNVFVADVPQTFTSAIFYRSLAPIENPETDEEAYNLMTGTLSMENNCFTLTSYDDAASTYQSSVGPYVAESAPEFELSRLYVDNSEANWSEIYVYGWGYGMNSDTTALTQITGTNIWYVDLPQSIPTGVETFLLKNTAGGSDWKIQSANLTVQENMNCYKLSSSNKGQGTWSYYSE